MPSATMQCPFPRAPSPGPDLEFDPFSDAYLADPYPLFARAREEAPVFYHPGLDAWVVSRYEDVKGLLLDHASCSAREVLDPVHPLGPEAQRILHDGGYRAGRILVNTDPPGHTRIRTALRSGFGPKRLAALEPAIRRLVHDHVTAFAADGSADIVAQLLFPVPAQVIFLLLGVPEEDVHQVKGWATSRAVTLWGRPRPEDQVGLADDLVAYWRYCEDHVARRLVAPADDLPSELLHLRDGDEAVLSVGEVVSLTFGLLFAGHETTTNLLANGLRHLLARPGLWESLRRDHSLIPGAVEEVLRFDGPVVAWRRTTTAPIEVGGVAIPEGARLLLLLGSANRDEAQFPGGDDFDIHRENAAHHLALGFGIHYCLGAALARLEARVVLEVLADRLPRLRLVPGQGIEFLPTVVLRGTRRLLVEWDAA